VIGVCKTVDSSLMSASILTTRAVQKVSSDGLLKYIYIYIYITNHVHCHLMYTPYATFRRSFHHCWGTCHSVAPVFVSLNRRMLPPAMQTTWKRLLWPRCRRGTAGHQARIAGVGTNETHLALSLGFRGDDRISQMLWWDFALRRQCGGGRCRESSQLPG
jgi:hypothetical protein